MDGSVKVEAKSWVLSHIYQTCPNKKIPFLNLGHKTNSSSSAKTNIGVVRTYLTVARVFENISQTYNS